MIYCQTINIERIAVHPWNDVDNTEYVELVKYGDAPIFTVWTTDGEEDYLWEFETSYPSDYERVKANIFDAMSVCDTMLELVEAMDGIFKNEFADILVVDECNECDGCEGCNKYKQ